MRMARRGRDTLIVGSVTLVHAGMLAWLIQQRPTAPSPAETPAMNVNLVPALVAQRRTPPPQASAPKPPVFHQAVRPAEAAPVPPMVLPEPPAAAAPAPAVAGADPLRDSLRRTLRRGSAGCASPDAVGLTEAERERCLDAFRAVGKDPPFHPGMGLSQEKRARFDAYAARRDTRRERMERPLGAAMTRYAPPDYDGEPYESGVGARDPYGPPPPSSSRAAPKLERLKP